MDQIKVKINTSRGGSIEIETTDEKFARFMLKGIKALVNDYSKKTKYNAFRDGGIVYGSPKGLV